MWVRQCDLDANADCLLPIPSRIASNEEFIPPVQSPQQKQYEERLREISDAAARKQGLDRRAFLRTGSGMAAALLALNDVFGPCYDVRAEEAQDQEAFRERWPKNQFIFDVQTHHVDVSRQWYENTPQGQQTTLFFRMLRPQAGTLQQSLELLNRAHYVKEVFGDSDTVMAIISGVPTREWNRNPLPPDQMAATRDYVNGLANSRRVLAHGLLRPNLGRSELSEMVRQVQQLRICAWKTYTGAELGERAWMLDDERVAYPFWERTRQLGVRNICVHKGLPLGAFNEYACTPKDLEKAARDWPDLNFIVYHSGYRGTGFLARGTGQPIRDLPTSDPQEIPWISDLIRILRRNPRIRNIYFELGSTFQQLSASNPVRCLHMLGQMIQVAGADHVLWGTDSIWGGSPQSQIERLRRLRMSPELMDRFGYAALTDEVKNQIFGLNAARLFGVDVAAQRNAIQADRLSELRREYQQNPSPSNTQYGWVWVEDGREPTVPVGAQSDPRP
jgi:predicted TIM-barrel fold metal-dependent hydrolase